MLLTVTYLGKGMLSFIHVIVGTGEAYTKTQIHICVMIKIHMASLFCLFLFKTLKLKVSRAALPAFITIKLLMFLSVNSGLTVKKIKKEENEENPI